jgi:hypothetical protein
VFLLLSLAARPPCDILRPQVVAGTLKVNNVARWDGVTWQRLADEDCEQRCGYAVEQNTCGSQNCEINGPVSALASSGVTLYVAGQFTTAGGKSARNLAQYFSGRWSPVGGGVMGSVYALQFFSFGSLEKRFVPRVRSAPCLYVAGSFAAVSDSAGMLIPVNNTARVCLNAEGTAMEEWQPVEVADSIGPVFALHAGQDWAV